MSISSRAFQVSLFALSWVVITGLSEVRAQTPIKIGIVSPTFGHAPFYEDAARFNAELAAFVREANKAQSRN